MTPQNTQGGGRTSLRGGAMSSLGARWAKTSHALQVRIGASTYLMLKARAEARNVAISVIVREALDLVLRERIMPTDTPRLPEEAV